MTLYYVNIRGIKSKIESLQEIVEEKKPDIIALVETHLEKEEQLKIEGYHIIRKDRNSEGEGVMLAMKERYRDAYVEMENDENDDGENIWIVLGTKTKYKIGVIYAPKGDKAGIGEIRTRYKNIEREIIKGQENEQKIIVVGDFNCKIGDRIPGDSKEVTKGGRELIKMAECKGLQTVNTRWKNGIWTRSEGGKRSTIDYFIIEEKETEMVKRFEIDERKEWTPYHVKKEENGYRTIYSDHNAIFVQTKWEGGKEQKEERRLHKI